MHFFDPLVKALNLFKFNIKSVKKNKKKKFFFSEKEKKEKKKKDNLYHALSLLDILVPVS